ncbi:hypothetical protein HMPREF1870_02616 [Bacteroidales bacterium KA00344]|nr:hypothetical protein HMPREF1870_02616 [Bacteroidales bacterium KA00344]
MDREEKFISDKFGHRTPFKVPEGYFDDLASQIMQNIPEQSYQVEGVRIVEMKESRWRRLRPIAIAAASVCVAVFGMGIYLHSGERGTIVSHDERIKEETSVSSYAAIDAIADYAMLDTEDMYAYMEDDN